ncbi:PRTRC system protein F [Burkholderia cenocepacia]|uniref:PRTRC system protein F n=1 Tax=Burkholderia cenocepacia TaxID=95486 RepID=UPI001BA1A1D7|nr:PRTRC system protein F [Burkholderia cenocepacia]MBR8509614.1 PRTRC system protein F [Burkholderia cenocepacia]
MTSTALTLPRIVDEVPARYVVGDSGQFSRNLALALMRGNMLTIEDAQLADDHRNERELARIALTRTWQELTDAHSIFEWSLRVSSDSCGPSYYRTGDDNSVWVSIHSDEGAGTAPVRFLRGSISHLENVMPGLGQTVLAVLYEACAHYLPSVLTPSETISIAGYMYWQGHANEIEALPELRMHYDDVDAATPEEFFDACSIPRRAEFFRDAPDWLVNPQQVLNTFDVHRAAEQDEIAALAVSACDEIYSVIAHDGPFARVDHFDSNAGPGIDFSLFLLWDHDDGTGRVIDDFLEHEMQGDALEAACAVSLSLTGKAVGNWFARMRNTSRLALAVEHLLDVIALRSPDSPAEAQPIQVRV